MQQPEIALIQTVRLAVSVQWMSKHANPAVRLALFVIIGGILVWLGTTRPKVVGSGPPLVVIKQGTNVSFEPGNRLPTTFVVHTTTSVSNSGQAEPHR